MLLPCAAAPARPKPDRRAARRMLIYRHSKHKKDDTWNILLGIHATTYGIPKAGFLLLTQFNSVNRRRTRRRTPRPGNLAGNLDNGVLAGRSLVFSHPRPQKGFKGRAATWTAFACNNKLGRRRRRLPSTNETPNARRFRITHNLFQVFQLRRLVVCRDTRTPSHASVTSSPPLDSER